VKMSAFAREAFDHECDALQTAACAFDGYHSGYASHVAKRPGMLARLALVFHALDAEELDAPLTSHTMDMAVRFLRRQERHAMAVYGAHLSRGTGMSLARDIARAILAAELGSFNRRDLAHRCRAFREAEAQDRVGALSYLTDCGWIVTEGPALAHGAAWTVNPKVHELFAEHGEAARQQREVVRRHVRGEDTEDVDDDA